MATILANTCATKYSFIDEKFTEIVCQVFEINHNPSLNLNRYKN